MKQRISFFAYLVLFQMYIIGCSDQSVIDFNVEKISGTWTSAIPLRVNDNSRVIKLVLSKSDNYFSLSWLKYEWNENQKTWIYNIDSTIVYDDPTNIYLVRDSYLELYFKDKCEVFYFTNEDENRNIFYYGNKYLGYNDSLIGSWNRQHYIIAEINSSYHKRTELVFTANFKLIENEYHNNNHIFTKGPYDYRITGDQIIVSDSLNNIEKLYKYQIINNSLYLCSQDKNNSFVVKKTE